MRRRLIDRRTMPRLSGGAGAGSWSWGTRFGLPDTGFPPRVGPEPGPSAQEVLAERGEDVEEFALLERDHAVHDV
ncbi:hypothetical protein, partial [Mycobacterium tuberculosis]|uniref:hypothetical protein n=1 Tax=Mycobacterium tuberculosis TaxID=1773 RepID=UPI003DA83CAF